MSTAQCDRCGQMVRVRKDGGLYKHQTAGGVECAPSADVAPPPAPSSPAGDRSRPQVTEAPAGGAPTPEPEPEREGGRGAKVPAGVEVRYRVADPCPYLDDPAWHQANAELAARKVARDGHKVTGPARHTGTSRAAGRVTVTYLVPTG